MQALFEVLRVYAVVTLATMLASQATALPWLGEYVAVMVGALFMWTAVHMSQRQPDGLRRYGLSLAGLLEPAEHAPSGLLGTARDLVSALRRALPDALREAAFALVVAAVVFPPFVLGFYLWHAPAHGFALAFPSDLPAYLLTQLLVVALPEEAFFRGYVQSRLSEQLGKQRKLLGASISWPALLWQAVLFGLIHFAVEPNPARLAVMFPGLLFGWLRARRGGIGASATFHALCNLLSDVLVRSWL